MTRELLPRFGMEPMRDVVLRAIEPPPNRLAALLSGAVDAAVLTHPETIIARRQGFSELIFYGDHIEFVSAGVVAPRETSLRNLISSAASSEALSRRSTGSRPTKRKLSPGWPKPQSLPRLTVSNFTGPGSSFFPGRHHTSKPPRENDLHAKKGSPGRKRGRAGEYL